MLEWALETASVPVKGWAKVTEMEMEMEMVRGKEKEKEKEKERWWYRP